MKQVSVVMTVFNAEKFVKDAVDSILNQNFEDFEFIIVNDGSTDSSLNILQSFTDERIILINQHNYGLSKSLNKGIKAASAEFIARMDADDISLPNRLKTQFDFLNSNSEYGAVGSNANLIDVNAAFLYTSNLPLSWEEIKRRLPETMLFHSSVMFRKSAWAKCGGYIEKGNKEFSVVWNLMADNTLWNQMASFTKLRNIKEPLLNYRIVPGSISNQDLKKSKFIKTISRKILQKNNISLEESGRLKRINKYRSSQKWGYYYLRIGSIYLNQNFNRKKALLNLAYGLYYRPFNIQIYLKFCACFLPKRSLRFLRSLVKAAKN